MKETLEQFLQRGGQIERLPPPTDLDEPATQRARKRDDLERQIGKQPGTGKIRIPTKRTSA